MGQNDIFETWYIIMLAFIPLILVVGSLLLLLNTDSYKKLESKLNSEIGLSSKKLIPQLEKSYDGLNTWMLKNKNLTGILFIFCSLLIFFFLRKS